MANYAEWRLLQSQALLDVFEKDCGRPAATMAEVRYWASAQNSEHLEFRVKRRLLELLFGANRDVQQQIGPRFAPPPRGWRVLRRKLKRSPPAIASVIAAVSGLVAAFSAGISRAGRLVARETASSGRPLHEVHRPPLDRSLARDSTGARISRSGDHDACLRSDSLFKT
jgi:hypothetical protein